MTGAGADWRPVAREADLVEGRLHAVVLDDVPIVLCRIGGMIHAVDDLCTHEHVRLSEGWLEDTAIVCPLHGARFDVTTGRCVGGRAAADLARHGVRCRGGVVELRWDARDG